jgi:hypothetical protein
VHVTHIAFGQPFGEVGRDVGRVIVRQQSGAMNDLCPIKPRGLQRQLERFRDVPDLHRCTELPGDDVAREVVQYRAEVKPAPADDLEIVNTKSLKVWLLRRIPESAFI